MCVCKSLTFFIGSWSSLSPAVRKLEKLSLNAMTRQNISCPSLTTFPSSSISSLRNKIYLFHPENIKPFTYSHRWSLRANCESCRLFAMKSWAWGRALVSSLWVSQLKSGRRQARSLEMNSDPFGIPRIWNFMSSLRREIVEKDSIGVLENNMHKLHNRSRWK